MKIRKEGCQPASRAIVIYHGGCRDGFCAAWVCDKALKEHDPEFYAGYYGQPPPDVTGQDVVLVDFSYPLSDMEQLADQAATMLVLDHHKTAEETLRVFKRSNVSVHFDMQQSGAGMAWNWFNNRGGRATVARGEEPRSILVDYVEDRDLWRHALPHSKEINAYISTLAFTFEAWSAASTTAAQDAMETFDPTLTARKLGAAALAKTDQYVSEVAKNARAVVFEGHDTRIVNAPQVDISEVLDALIDGQPFVMAWWQRADGVFQYSLRSRGDFDVSALAKKYGGGGHKNAAGFQSPSMLDLEAAAP